MYLVVGGAGRTGRRVASLLVRDGHEVVVASRRPDGDDHVRAVSVDLSRDLRPGLLSGVDGVVVSVEPPADTTAADALMHRGVANLARLASATAVPVVLISQIYITRAAEHPGLAGIIRARAAGEQALRDSGGRYTIIRPGWLTNDPATGVRLEQGDTGDGTTSRDTVAQAAVAALLHPGAAGKTFEIYDSDTAPDWPALFTSLRADAEGS